MYLMHHENVAYAPSSTHRAVCQQRQAAAYCGDFKASPGCLEVCLRRLPSSPYIEVRFWCLQTVHEVGSTSVIYFMQCSVWQACSMLHAVCTHLCLFDTSPLN